MRKRKKKKENIEEVYSTVKPVLSSFLSPQLFPDEIANFKSIIQETVTKVSKFQIFFSYKAYDFFNYCINNRSRNDFYNLFPKADRMFWSKFSTSCKQKICKIKDPDNYSTQNITNNSITFNLNNHSFLSQQYVHDQYQHCKIMSKCTLLIESRTIFNPYSILPNKKFTMMYFQRFINKIIVAQCNMIQNDDIKLWFMTHPWMYVRINYWLMIYTLADIQNTLAETKRSFILFPTFEVGIKHIGIDQTGMFELSRSVFGREKIPSAIPIFFELEKIGKNYSILKDTRREIENLQII